MRSLGEISGLYLEMPKTNNPKRFLSGAALQKHLTKQVKDLDDFNRETLRIIKDTERMKRKQQPLYKLSSAIGWGIASASLTGIVTCFVQPQHITTGILCGFSLGLSGALIDK